MPRGARRLPTERRRAPAHTMLVLEIEAGEIRPELVVVEG